MPPILGDWIEKVSNPSCWKWYLTRLSATDTGATNTHMAGLYMPKDIMFEVLPVLNKPDAKNPDTQIQAVIPSHDLTIENHLRGVWYNNKSRDECRFTRWGGSKAPVQNKEHTGSLVLLAFHIPPEFPNADNVEIWVCTNPEEENFIESLLGRDVSGDNYFLTRPDGAVLFQKAPRSLCDFDKNLLPKQWLNTMPSGQAIFEKTTELVPPNAALSWDQKLLRRRECEEKLFMFIEKHVYLPTIREGFPTIDSFVSFALSMLNSRKSRAGYSLERHLKKIFTEVALPFAHNPETETSKKPDFLFPSAAAYHDASFQEKALRMLGVKTSCKDRWRQVTTEANRIDTKHLFTLQPGISVSQHKEMKSFNITLVVPKPLHTKYPPAVREDLLSLEQFLGQLRSLASSHWGTSSTEE